MPSALNTKINSYALERGIEFGEAVSLTPTRTGSNPLGTFTRNTGTPITFEPTVNPPGGSGSWRFPTSVTSANVGLFSNTTPTTTELLGLFDNDYSVGFWFRMNYIPSLSAVGAVTLVTLGNGSNAGAIFNITGSAHPTNPSQLMIDTANSFTYIPLNLTVGTWYYVALTKRTTFPHHSVYLNGAHVTTFNESGTGASGNFNFGRSSNTASAGSWNISNFYLAPLSQIGPTQIAEIWQVGSTIPTPSRTVKYFNGTSWVDSIGQKVWNGTEWVDWNAKRFDGSAWINV
jgi:hypothetical protein